MMPLVLNHFQAMLLFAFVVSVAFAYLSRESARDRQRYAALAFAAFLGAALLMGWIMYAVQR